MAKIITVPFGWLLSFLYDLTNNYGVALIIFAALVQLILLPISAKSKKSSMKMSRIQPKIQAIQEKYANDKQKQNEAIQQLQKEEGATMGCGGCLWSLVPLLILIPLLQIIRQPIVYLLGESAETAQQIVKFIQEANPALFSGNSYYSEVIAAQAIPQYAEQLKALLPDLSANTLAGINFSFLNLDLGAMPQFNVFNSSVWAWDWAHIGLFLIPVISAGQQVLSMFLSQRSNNSVITDKNGMEDKETAQKSQSNQSSKVMMWMMPIMSLWIGFTVPAGLSVYWFVGGVIRMVEDVLLTKHYRKVYDAEDAERLRKHLEEEALEAEKERIRAEKRAANPDGITENTSKKKLQKKQQQAEEAAKAAAKREYDAKRGVTVEEQPEKQTMSGIADRPYCKGRAYDPNRYGSSTTEE
ncbi:MAG: YidC/Oxa1 family membrane protein insertase [Oscillospiraceae bacterium]|nr:YidC/Oxa1 family membrane protein insertase [Oscillospiraceae bacterium]